MIYLPTFSHKESTKCRYSKYTIPGSYGSKGQKPPPPPGWTLHLKILWKYSQRFPPSEAPLKLTASSTNSKFAPDKKNAGPHKGKERIVQPCNFQGGFLLNLHREKKPSCLTGFFWLPKKNPTWWFQPPWKLPQMGGENKKYLKPPPRKET